MNYCTESLLEDTLVALVAVYTFFLFLPQKLEDLVLTDLFARL